MALQTGNSISLLDVAIEFGDSPAYQINDFYRGGIYVQNREENANVPIANTISLQNFYGANAGDPTRPLIQLTISSGTVFQSYDLLKALANTPGFYNGNSDIYLTISEGAALASANNPNTGYNSNILANSTANLASYAFFSARTTSTVDTPDSSQVNGTSSNNYALYVPSGINPGNKVTIINNGIISGHGGNGGWAGYSTAAGGAGSGGGHGIFAGRPINLVNRRFIQGGGGGGGGGPGSYVYFPAPPKSGGGGYNSYFGGGGGGGGGFIAGRGGETFPYSGFPAGNPGGYMDLNSVYSAGGAGAYSPGPSAGDGGSGGFTGSEFAIPGQSSGPGQGPTTNGGNGGVQIVRVGETNFTTNSEVNTIFSSFPLSVSTVYKDANLVFYNANTLTPNLNFYGTYSYGSAFYCGFYFENTSVLGMTNGTLTFISEPTTATSWYNNQSSIAQISQTDDKFRAMSTYGFAFSANVTNTNNTDSIFTSSVSTFYTGLGSAYEYNYGKLPYYVETPWYQIVPYDISSSSWNANCGIFIDRSSQYRYYDGDIINLDYTVKVRQVNLYDSHIKEIKGNIFLQPSSKLRMKRGKPRPSVIDWRSGSYSNVQANTAQTYVYTFHANGLYQTPPLTTNSGNVISWLYDPNGDWDFGTGGIGNTKSQFYVLRTAIGGQDSQGVSFPLSTANSGLVQIYIDGVFIQNVATPISFGTSATFDWTNSDTTFEVRITPTQNQNRVSVMNMGVRYIDSSGAVINSALNTVTTQFYQY